MSLLLSLQPRDPVVARDGRPFGDQSGNRMRSLNWPLPSTVAGAIRTSLGYAVGGHFDSALVERLKLVASHGPLPVSEGRLYLPAPHDALVGSEGDCVTLRPESPATGGVDLPDGLLPVLPPPTAALLKFADSPPWWSLEKMEAWLLESGDAPEEFFQPSDEFRASPRIDERTHVRIDPKTFAAQAQLLFTSAGLVLDDLPEPGDDARSHFTSLAVRVDPGSDATFRQQLTTLDEPRTVGGERRLLRIHAADPNKLGLWNCPSQLQQALARVQVGDGIRMVLATPAIFKHGWRPDWLVEEDGRVGTPPGVDSSRLKMRLVAVSNQRWEAVSGWSYEHPQGPKSVKRLTPAGGVYFFRVEAIDSGSLSQLWLQPISDDPQDRQDGFGLATWGRWSQR